MFTELFGVLKHIKTLLKLIKAIEILLPLMDSAWDAVSIVFKKIEELKQQNKPEPTDNQKLDMAVTEVKKYSPSIKDYQARAAIEVALLLYKNNPIV